jgi:hypothetical protein
VISTLARACRLDDRVDELGPQTFASRPEACERAVLAAETASDRQDVLGALKPA